MNNVSLSPEKLNTSEYFFARDLLNGVIHALESLNQNAVLNRPTIADSIQLEQSAFDLFSALLSTSNSSYLRREALSAFAAAFKLLDLQNLSDSPSTTKNRFAVREVAPVIPAISFAAKSVKIKKESKLMKEQFMSLVVSPRVESKKVDFALFDDLVRDQSKGFFSRKADPFFDVAGFLFVSNQSNFDELNATLQTFLKQNAHAKLYKSLIQNQVEKNGLWFEVHLTSNTHDIDSLARVLNRSLCRLGAGTKWQSVAFTGESLDNDTLEAVVCHA